MVSLFTPNERYYVPLMCLVREPNPTLDSGVSHAVAGLTAHVQFGFEGQVGASMLNKQVAR